MTASKISQIAALMKASELMEAQNKPQGADVAFGALLSQTPEGRDQGLSMSQGLTGAAKPNVASQAAYEKGVAQLGYRENTVTQSENPAAKNELPEDAPEKLQSFEKKAIEAVAQELGVTEEEVAEQMEAMGLTVLDLMDPSKLAGLVLELTGSEDMGELLLSENFQQLLGEIGELSQDLMAALDISLQEMPQVMDQLEAMLSEDQAVAAETEVEVTPEQPEQPEQAAQPELSVQPEEAADSLQKGTEAVQTLAKPQEAVQQEAVEDGDSLGQQPVQEVEQPEEAPQEALEDDTEGSMPQKESSGEAGKAKPQQGQVTYQTTAQTVSQGQAVEVTQTVTQARVDVEGIMRQISQMTRIVVSQAETTIEMQLNPENLGKVYLQVVSRQGTITAQLAAQDEAVKQALESQIAALKENMNQQGLKVEAVEVTIASHEFERNLEENQKNPSKEQQEAEMEQASRRNINLNSLDELEGLMSEEESLVARMMSDQGNSVDLTA